MRAIAPTPRAANFGFPQEADHVASGRAISRSEASREAALAGGGRGGDHVAAASVHRPRPAPLAQERRCYPFGDLVRLSRSSCRVVASRVSTWERTSDSGQPCFTPRPRYARFFRGRRQRGGSERLSKTRPGKFNLVCQTSAKHQEPVAGRVHKISGAVHDPVAVQGPDGLFPAK